MFSKWVFVRRWHNQRYNWKNCDTCWIKICWKFNSRNWKCYERKNSSAKLFWCYQYIIKSKSCKEYFSIRKQDIFEGNTNEVFPIVDQQQCVNETDNFVKEFDAALTIEIERLKKDALKPLLSYRLSLLVPPLTANVEQNFSAINVVCSPLQASLNISDLDLLMRMNWNGVVKLSDHMPLILLKKTQRWIGRMTLLSHALVNK